MKSIFIAGIAIIMIIALVLVFGFGTIADRRRTTQDWNVSDEYGTVNGTWGTEILVEYEDGTIENLNEPLPTLEISFKDKKVSSFKYVLSSRGTSNDYNFIEIDMSSFNVLTSIAGQEGAWGTEGTFGDTISLNMDGSWNNVYTVTVEASELEILGINQTYNLSFVPSGSITYRGLSTGSWNYVPLPNWFYLTFRVKEDTTSGGTVEKYIEVELGSGTVT